MSATWSPAPAATASIVSSSTDQVWTGGNQPAQSGDHPPMRCDTIREALSARIDGEDPGLGDQVLDDHLAGCSACAGWADDLSTLHRMVRVREAEPVPDLSAAILAGTPGPRAPRRPGVSGSAAPGGRSSSSP